MNNEPNREQELTEKELKGIAGGLSGPYEPTELLLGGKITTGRGCEGLDGSYD